MQSQAIDYKLICLNVIDLVKTTGAYIRKQGDLLQVDQVEEKGDHNYVTYVDKTAEGMLVEGLKSILPGAGYITEEETDSTKGAIFNWIIDPLDGTTNFIHQVPVYCVSVALQENNEIVIGVILEINLNECFYAWKGGPAMLNERVIRISESINFNTSLLATGFPYHDYGRMDAYIEVFREMIKQTAGLRRLGSAAADMAYVAAGRFEGFYEYGLHPWDVAAGVLIVRQAGGVVIDFKGGDNAVFGKELICGNSHTVEKMKEVISRYFD